MPKITMIGAGSVVFARRLMIDILSWPELQDAEISLMDIDEERLELVGAFVRKAVAARGLGAKVGATTDRRRALDGADYVITAISVGRAYEQDRPEWALPRKYGLD